ncbi:MAG: ATP synthase F1 subunit gamma [Thermodesulfovibrionales bacterium]|nr:ATP synthase F1 subunit gamma [Thermodesulfovibrionales bacterium]
MPTLRDIRKRLKAIASTKKITSAMKMVAAAKLRKVQDRMINFRPYAVKMESVLSDLASGSTEAGGHPLLVWRPKKKVEVIVLTSDRGLCGAYNSNILRVASQQIDSLKKEGVEVSISVIGRKARDYFKRRSIAIRNAWIGLSGKITYANAQEIAKDVIENYENENIDEFIIVFSEFKSMIVQKPTTQKLLPIGEIGSPQTTSSTATATFEFEPSREVLFERLLPKYVEIQIYRALLESQASEEAARMTAMENASKNCEDMIAKVTLIANKVRQAGITKELMDIVGGVEALEK